MSDLLNAPTLTNKDDDDNPLSHIVTFKNPDVALCGEDMTGCEWADEQGELCLVCDDLSGGLDS